MPVDALTHRIATEQYNNRRFSEYTCERVSKQLISNITDNAHGEYSKEKANLAESLVMVVNAPECPAGRKKNFPVVAIPSAHSAPLMTQNLTGITGQGR